MTHTIEELREQAKIFKALNHETRLLILELLIERPRTVEDLCIDIGEYMGHEHTIEQATISSHLKRLRRVCVIAYNQAGHYHEYYCRDVQMVCGVMDFCAARRPPVYVALRRRRRA
jgi:predicted transcriptional regulator